MAVTQGCGGHHHRDEGWSWFWFIFFVFFLILMVSIPYAYYRRASYCGDEPCPDRYYKRPSRLKDE